MKKKKTGRLKSKKSKNVPRQTSEREKFLINRLDFLEDLTDYLRNEIIQISRLRSSTLNELVKIGVKYE